MLQKEEKALVIKEYATHEGDTGSPEVQVAILTKRINDLTEHLRTTRRIITPARPSQDGRPKTEHAQLSDENRHRTVSFPDCPFGDPQIKYSTKKTAILADSGFLFA